MHINNNTGYYTLAIFFALYSMLPILNGYTYMTYTVSLSLPAINLSLYELFSLNLGLWTDRIGLGAPLPLSDAHYFDPLAIILYILPTRLGVHLYYAGYLIIANIFLIKLLKSLKISGHLIILALLSISFSNSAFNITFISGYSIYWTTFCLLPGLIYYFNKASENKNNIIDLCKFTLLATIVINSSHVSMVFSFTIAFLIFSLSYVKFIKENFFKLIVISLCLIASSIWRIDFLYNELQLIPDNIGRFIDRDPYLKENIYLHMLAPFRIDQLTLLFNDWDKLVDYLKSHNQQGILGFSSGIICGLSQIFLIIFYRKKRIGFACALAAITCIVFVEKEQTYITSGKYEFQFIWIIFTTIGGILLLDYLRKKNLRIFHVLGLISLLFLIFNNLVLHKHYLKEKDTTSNLFWKNFNNPKTILNEFKKSDHSVLFYTDSLHKKVLGGLLVKDGILRNTPILYNIVPLQNRSRGVSQDSLSDSQFQFRGTIGDLRIQDKSRNFHNFYNIKWVMSDNNDQEENGLFLRKSFTSRNGDNVFMYENKERLGRVFPEPESLDCGKQLKNFRGYDGLKPNLMSIERKSGSHFNVRSTQASMGRIIFVQMYRKSWQAFDLTSGKELETYPICGLIGVDASNSSSISIEYNPIKQILLRLISFIAIALMIVGCFWRQIRRLVDERKKKNLPGTAVT